jgi:hypothetical protein
MGRQHRVAKVGRALVACATLLSGGVLCACSREPDQKEQLRRDVLRANNMAAERKKQFDAVRVLDENGKLVPSNQRVAGIVLPRGYQPKFKLDYESSFDGELPYGKLATYFTEQLDFVGVQRPNNATLTFLEARSKGDTQAKPVSVSISPVPGREDWSRIRIQTPQPLPAQLQSKAQIDAELSLRRKREMY